MLVGLGILFVPPVAVAQDTAALRMQAIRENCQSIRLLLDTLQRRDLVSRTNLGREYESMGRLFSAFKQRVQNNNLDAAAFTQLATQFTTATNNFRSAYVRYDDSLIRLQQINCQDSPGDFDVQLASVREQRDATEGLSRQAAAIAGQYRDRMADLQLSLPNEATQTTEVR